MAKSKKRREAGRPAGVASKKSGYIRDHAMHIRITEGFDKTLHALIAEAGYKTPSDVLHDALQQLGYKKLQSKKDIFWLSKIQ